LFAGYRRAQRAGKPLLVFVIERDHFSDIFGRGAIFGQWLNAGSDSARAPLALYEVVCARMDEIRRLAPNLPPSTPLMVAIDTDRQPAVVRGIEASDTSASSLGKLIVPIPTELDRFAAQTSAAMNAFDRLTVENVLARGTPTPALADRAASIVFRASRNRPALERVLAQAVERRLVRSRIPGSSWAQVQGCGMMADHREGDEIVGIGCGMGESPPKSLRFLHFYTQVSL
jgi:hypothetical protein